MCFCFFVFCFFVCFFLSLLKVGMCFCFFVFVCLFVNILKVFLFVFYLFVCLFVCLLKVGMCFVSLFFVFLFVKSRALTQKYVSPNTYGGQGANTRICFLLAKWLMAKCQHE